MADQESTHVYNEILEEGVVPQARKLDQLPGQSSCVAQKRT